jgi:hypothetical protein
MALLVTYHSGALERTEIQVDGTRIGQQPSRLHNGIPRG